MDAETFIKIAGLLNLTAVEIAKESGCSPEAVRSARMGRRPVSAKLEKFVIEKLRKASGDAAVRLVLEVCKMEGLNEKALLALREFEQEEGVKLSDDDTVYVWVKLNDDSQVSSVMVSNRNHSPEGIACEVRNLADIEDWLNHEDCYVFDYDNSEWVTVKEKKADMKEKDTLQIVGRLFRPVRLTEKADTLYQHENAQVVLSEYAGHVLSAETSDGWNVKLFLDGEQLPEIEINLEYAGDSEEMSDEDWEAWCDNSMPREEQLEIVEAYLRQAFNIVIRDMASESYTTWPELYEFLTEKLS